MTPPERESSPYLFRGLVFGVPIALCLWALLAAGVWLMVR